ncbi:MAG: hypothetical protein M3346_08300 [Actinomycetota bacterium]|nr:hypothetical protein [Actinomycetota bacterium]
MSPSTLSMPESRERAVAVLFCMSLTGAVIYPIVQNWKPKKRDGFPLSYYPMFSAKRSETARITHLQGVCRSGEATSIHYKYAGSGGLNQVRRQLHRLARNGSANQTCRKVAQRVARSDDPGLRDVVKVRLVTSEFVLEDCFRDPCTVSERVHGTEPVRKARL